MTQANAELATLAAGGRTSFFGFLLRLAARMPFLFIAGRMYGTEALGRFAYAVLVVEFAAQVATMGLKRGLAQQLATSERDHRFDVWDAMIVCAVASLFAAGVLILLPQAMFPNSSLNGMDRLLPLVILPLAASDIALSALAYRGDLGATVRARSVVEPWALGITAGALAFVTTRDGLIIAYVASIGAAFLASMIPMVKSFGFPTHEWRPRPGLIWDLARRNTPLAAADAIEWASRRIDIAILGLFVSPSAVGIYWGAQQVVSLPQKLKTTFDPVLAPVITQSLGKGDKIGVARHIRQVAFWITAAQLLGLLMFGIPAVGVMGIIGPAFVMGAGALVVLLSAEVFASTGAVAESALIYVARKRNMMISIGTIILQAILCASLILVAKGQGLSEFWQMAAAAFGLLLALFAASIAKAWLAERLLGGPVVGWRWTLVPTAALAGAVGWAAVHYLPEWATMTLGMTAIFATYVAALWFFAFGPEDRELFRLRRATPEVAGPVEPNAVPNGTLP
ncbi:MAG: lipopolysaccharide biosynthesis protein [Pseudomonadota bacterium]